MRDNSIKVRYMSRDPLALYRKLDPKIIKEYEDSDRMIYSDGALPAKIKLLIAMDLDAIYGDIPGVVALAKRAMKLGATKEEVMEALRVTYGNGGAHGLYMVAGALEKIFQE
jgi:alkylhydroperoxidase/carboxymuconolactone decarboxylase family protein YurZ